MSHCLSPVSVFASFLFHSPLYIDLPLIKTNQFSLFSIIHLTGVTSETPHLFEIAFFVERISKRFVFDVKNDFCHLSSPGFKQLC